MSEAVRVVAVCQGCACTLGAYEAARWGVCMECTRARARACGASGRCMCGRKRIEGEALRVGSRSWVPCKRCLGSVRQLS